MNGIADALIGLAVPIGGAVGWYLRDRRKSRAEAEVAERTVGSDVELKDAAVQETHLAYVERTFELERASLNRQVVDLREEVGRLRAELGSRDELVDRLRTQAGQMQGQLEELTRQTRDLQEQLEVLSTTTTTVTSHGRTTTTTGPSPGAPPEQEEDQQS